MLVGLTEFIILFNVFVPMIFIVYIILKSEPLIRNEQEQLSSKIRDIKMNGIGLHRLLKK